MERRAFTPGVLIKKLLDFSSSFVFSWLHILWLCFFLSIHNTTFYSSQKAGYCFLGKKVKHQREGKTLQNGICCTVHEVHSGSALRVRARAIYCSGNVEEMTGYHYIPPALESVCDSSVLGVTWHLWHAVAEKTAYFHLFRGEELQLKQTQAGPFLMLRSDRGAGMQQRCYSREENHCDNLLLLFSTAVIFALPFVHLFCICFEGLDPLLHWGNCSCFWRMQSLDDSLDFTVSLRPDCKPLNLIPGKSQEDFTEGTERALSCLPT